MENFTGYVSQKNWKDSDKLVECTVECNIDGTRHKAVVMAQDPLEAIRNCQKHFESVTWEKVEKIKT